MKKLLTLFSVLGLAGALSAQIAPNSIAPNFVAQDINGNTVNLYEILESGKPVIMDVSATWCGPCWSYHNGHALKNLYEQYGPAGTDELMVVFVEGDPTTNTACLTGPTGCNSSTQGNWIEGTPYPILDNAEIADDYEIGYFPTVYLICPTHLVKEVGQLSTAALRTQAQNCPDQKQGADITSIAFGSDYAYGKICGTQTFSPNYLVVNTGTDTLKSVVIELRVNGQLVQTKNYTEPIDPMFPRVIDFDPISATGATIVKSTITSINGTTLPNGGIVKQKSYAKAKNTGSKELTLELKTDGYAQETYWELIDEAGTVYAFGGNENVGPNGAGTGTPDAGPGTYANSSVITENIEVPENGCYFLHMVDSYGDGMCYQATGYYKLFETATPSNILAEGGCDFGDERTIFGAEGIVGVNDVVDAGSMRVFPNPAKEMIRVDFSMKTTADVQITVSNTLGQIVRDLGSVNFAAGANSQSIVTADLAAGIYVLNLRTAEGTISRTFSKN